MRSNTQVVSANNSPVTSTETGFDRRGQIGASTLIILIAALIVAASTAGVLMNVTGFLQSEAAVTGDSVSADIDSPVRVAGVTGRVNQSADPPALNRTRIVVALDGSSPVNISSSTVRVETKASKDTLVYRGTGPDQGVSFGIAAVADEKNTAPILTETGDRFAVLVDTPPLAVGDQVTIRLSLETGATKTVRFRVPPQIDSESAVILQ
ncbi:hypothetical protein [Halodesulfurarchaeum sp.]|uniref:hypothetical protein n=1 Tax=Halodesulfurarchaeum sp. TaxID=1980530 RepID=UPI002FC303B9